eukprot:SAG25_NODE_1748_length_2401_cov_20.010860_2_plen_441_part_00
MSRQDDDGTLATRLISAAEVAEVRNPAAASAVSSSRRCRALWDQCKLPVCMIAMGLSAFPATETLLLQSSMFANCFVGRDGSDVFPEYYAEAMLALFLPGLPLMLMQNSLDQRFDLRYGYGWIARRRVLFGHGIQLVCLALFLLGIHQHGRLSRVAMHALLLGTFFAVGIGCSTVYGTHAQAVSIFSERYHPFFFIGTYSVSFYIAPVNLIVGELCEDRFKNGTFMAHVGVLPQPHWPRIFVFYAAGGALNLVGLAAFFVLSGYLDDGREAFAQKELQLRSNSSDCSDSGDSQLRCKQPRVNMMTHAGGERQTAHDVVATQLPMKELADLSTAGHYEEHKENRGSGGAQVGQADKEVAAVSLCRGEQNGGSPCSTDEDAPCPTDNDAPLRCPVLDAVWRECTPVGLLMLAILLENLLVTSRQAGRVGGGRVHVCAEPCNF